MILTRYEFDDPSALATVDPRRLTALARVTLTLVDRCAQPDVLTLGGDMQAVAEILAPRLDNLAEHRLPAFEARRDADHTGYDVTARFPWSPQPRHYKVPLVADVSYRTERPLTGAVSDLQVSVTAAALTCYGEPERPPGPDLAVSITSGGLNRLLGWGLPQGVFWRTERASSP